MEAQAAQELSKAVEEQVRATAIAHKVQVKNQQFHLPENKDEFVPIVQENNGNARSRKTSTDFYKNHESRLKLAPQQQSRLSMSTVKESPSKSRQSVYATSHALHQTMSSMPKQQKLLDPNKDMVICYEGAIPNLEEMQ